jgi:hypothetical protein
MFIIYLVALFTCAFAASSSNGMSSNHTIRNLGFKLIIFKKKEYPKLLENIKHSYKMYYEKSLATMSEYMNEYEKLSSEDKAIVDFIISTIL